MTPTPLALGARPAIPVHRIVGLGCTHSARRA